MLIQQVELDLENKLDRLTTEADNFYTELEDEGRIHDGKALLSFLDELVDFLEGKMGGRVESVRYKDSRHLAMPGNRKQMADFGLLLAQLAQAHELSRIENDLTKAENILDTILGGIQ